MAHIKRLPTRHRYIDGNKRFWNQAMVKNVAKKYIGILREFKQFTPNLDDEWPRFLTENYVLPKWNAVKPEMQREIDRGIGFTNGLLTRSRANKPYQTVYGFRDAALLTN